jgi:hypothetical protein
MERKWNKKKREKLLGLVLSLVLIASLVLPAVAYAAGLDNPRKPDRQKPVPATNVELVKKATVKKPGQPIVPPGQSKKKTKEAATGILGDYPVSGNRYAIVIGISDYPGESNDLSYSDDDANDMYTALTEVYGFTTVTLLKDGNATREAILSAIDNIPKDAGEVVFFFSGHGMKGIADDGDKERWDEAIVAHDGSSIVPIWDGELKGAFLECPTSRIIFVFDTCMAGGMKKDLDAPGRVIAMATTESSLAIESANLGNGEFSYYFVDQGMLGSKADRYDHDEMETPDVTVEEAFDYAQASCSYDKPTIGDYFENDLLL